MALRLLALTFLAGAALAGPYQRNGENKCAKECPPQFNSKFDWKVGSAYRYHFKAMNNVTYTGSQSQKSSVEGTLEHHFVNPCQVVLKLRNIRIDQKLTSEEKDELRNKLEIPLAYAKRDDEVEHICPSPEESTQSLNIKKAMITSFINSMPKLDASEETEAYDSLGKCETKYTPTYEDGLVIKIEKNLKSCTNKRMLFAPFLKTKFPSLMFEDDRLVCKQHIEDKILKRVECNETEKMKPPMKDKSNWIEFSSNLLITFLEQKPVENFKINEDRPQEELLYGIEEIRKGDSNRKDVERILVEICPKNNHVVDIGVSNDFIKLCELAKSLPFEELEKIYESLKYGDICSSEKVKDLFVDTLPTIGSGAAVKLMTKLIENQDVTGLKAKIWPASFALIQKPTKEMISTIIPMVKKDSSTPVLLGVSAMIHKICVTEGCERVDPVNEVVSVFNEYIGEKCSFDDDEKALSALKAFGNMGYHGKARKNIIACIQDNSKSNRLRLAAIDSFRRIDETRPNEFIDIYSKTDEDHEIRIAAFASACKHADKEQFQKIKETAERESNLQVDAYVSSYIESMKRTSSPTKQELKKSFQKLKESHSTKFKYWENSKHIEKYAFNKALNVGGGFEADVIHSSESKIPRSVSTRFDVDIFDKSVNLLEFGIRAEGLEKIIEKIVGMKNSHPKQSSWNRFSLKHLMGDTDAEMSLFLRTFNTEIFDVSGSDLSGIGEVIRIADMMNTLAKGSNADFSHSFVFMNSKLVIPSVTGRSYSIDFTGSSSVGVTAKNKVDILSLPRTANVALHFQPSVNMQISTTIGIQSNRERPDMKLVSRLHLESNVECQFHVRDGNIAIASLKLPSENIMKVKLSTDLISIDEKHNEKKVYTQVQKKIDHCFTRLDKPLGIIACTTVEVPKPLVTRSFPYLLPFGNGEFVLKKSDDNFDSFVMHLEIQKHSGPHIKYKGFVDTPGSKISRRFSVDFDVKNQRDQKQLLIEFRTPFKIGGGSVSLVKKKGLLQAVAELHCDSKQIIYGNTTLVISESRSRTIYQFSSVTASRNEEPLKLNVSFAVVKGRKNHVSFDFNMDKPKSKPITIKGAVTKEGRLEFSTKSEWKLSTDVQFISSDGHRRFSGTVNKKSKQIQAISLNMGIGYQKIGEREYTTVLSGTSQKSSEKINTVAKFETSKDPESNWRLNWDIQRESNDSIKNSIALNYGQNKKRNYVNLKQVSRMPQTGHGENSISIEIPQLNIRYGISVKHNIEMGVNPKFHIDADLLYNPNKHMRGLMDLKYQSEGPLKASGKIEVEYNGINYIYEDKVEEKDNNEIVGISRFIFKRDKEIYLKYKCKKLSDDSIIHYEIQSSLQTPSSRNPIESNASLRINSESLDISGNFGSRYFVQAHSDQDRTEVHLNHPFFEGKFKLKNTASIKNLSLDLMLTKPFTANTRHIKGVIETKVSESKKEIHFEVTQNNDMKVTGHSTVEIVKKPSGEAYKSLTKFEVTDMFYVSLNESGDLKVLGDHFCTFEWIAKGSSSTKIQSKRITGKETATYSIIVFKENIVVVTMQLDASLKDKGNKRVISVKSLITSPVYSFANISVDFIQRAVWSGPSTNLQSILHFKQNEKVYQIELNSNLQLNNVEFKAAIETPYKKYVRQTLNITIQSSDDEISSSVNIEYPINKVLSITTNITKNKNGLTATCKITPPAKTKIYSNKELKDIHIKLIVTPNDSENKKYLNIIVSHNDTKLIDINAYKILSSREFEAEGNLKIFNSLDDKFQKFSIKCRLTKNFLSASGNFQLAHNQEHSIVSEFKKEKNIMSTNILISAPYRNLDVKIHLSEENQLRRVVYHTYVNGKRIHDVEFTVISSSHALEIKGVLETHRIPKTSFDVKCEKIGNSFTIFANIVKSKSALISMSFKRLSQTDRENILMKTSYFEKTILDVEVSKEDSKDNSKHLNLRVSGEFPAVSVTFLKNYNDPTTAITELRVCQETSEIDCYSLKSNHKSEFNSRNYTFYQAFMITLERSTGSSHTEPLGSLEVVATKDKFNSVSKLIFQSKGNKVGYKTKFHKRQHQDDHHFFDTDVILPQRTSRFKALILHNSQSLKLKLDAILDVEEPDRKFSFDMKKDIIPELKDISGYIKMDHPTRSEPFLFTYKFEPADETFFKGKMLLHYSTIRGKTLTLELDPKLEEEPYGKRSMVFKLYTQDKTLDTHLKLIKEHSRQADKLGYEWKHNLDGDEKMGGVIATFHDKKAGKPKSANIKYYSPSTDYEVQGSVAEALENASFRLFSRGQKLQELRLKTDNSCVHIELNHSGPIMKGFLCINKQEGDIAHLIKANIYCRQRKCFDARLYLDPQKPGFVSTALKWEKQDILRYLRKVTSYNLFRRFSLKQGIRNLKEKLHLNEREIMKYIQIQLKEGIKRIEETKELFFRKWKSTPRWNSEVMDGRLHSIFHLHLRHIARSILKFTIGLIPLDYFALRVFRPLHDATVCFFREYLKLIVEHIPQLLNIVMEVTKAQFEHCLRKFCVQGTFCHDFFLSYQENGTQAAQKLFYKHIYEAKEYLKLRVPSRTLHDFTKPIHWGIHLSRKEMKTFFRNFIADKIISHTGHPGKMLEKMHHKAIDAIDKFFDKINNLLIEDEDYRIAKSVIEDAKVKVTDVWKDKEELAKKSFETIRKDIEQNAKKMMHKQIQVQKFDLKAGDVQFSFRQPLGAIEVQILKNELRSIKRKLEEYLRN